MGTWGTGPFEDDDSADWVYDLEAAADTALVLAALRAVAETVDYLEAPDATIGLAAAEVVAAACDRPWQSLPDPVRHWVDAHRGRFDAADLVVAVAAVDRVLRDQSELRELWLEAGDTDWIARVYDLRARLAA